MQPSGYPRPKCEVKWEGQAHWEPKAYLSPRCWTTIHWFRPRPQWRWEEKSTWTFTRSLPRTRGLANSFLASAWPSSSRQCQWRWTSGQELKWKRPSLSPTSGFWDCTRTKCQTGLRWENESTLWIRSKRASSSYKNFLLIISVQAWRPKVQSLLQYIHLTQQPSLQDTLLPDTVSFWLCQTVWGHPAGNRHYCEAQQRL